MQQGGRLAIHHRGCRLQPLPSATHRSLGTRAFFKGGQLETVLAAQRCDTEFLPSWDPPMELLTAHSCRMWRVT